MTHQYSQDNPREGLNVFMKTGPTAEILRSDHEQLRSAFSITVRTKIEGGNQNMNIHLLSYTYCQCFS